MTEALLHEIAGYLNRFPFVTWDRYIAGTYVDSDLSYFTTYGWIARPDGRSDFVLLSFTSIPDDGTIDPELIEATTSSATYSREIQTLLRGSDEGHVDCKRIEVGLPGLVERIARTRT